MLNAARPPIQAISIDLDGVRSLLAEMRAAGEKRRAEFPEAPSFAPTLARLEELDYRALVAGGFVR